MPKKYQRKTRDTWEIHANYDGGWEYVYGCLDYKEARERLKEYRENAPQYPARIVYKREKIESEEGNDNQ